MRPTATGFEWETTGPDSWAYGRYRIIRTGDVFHAYFKNKRIDRCHSLLYAMAQCQRHLAHNQTNPTK